MRSSRRTAAAAEATEGTAAGSGAPTLEMDPWKEDRVRDFVALNTIQRLRAYHLPSDAPMPPMEAVNVARARNLILLPRAVPDFRPCQLETKPKAAALRQRRRQQRAARTQAHVAKRAAHDNEEDHDGVSLTSSSMSTSSSQDDSSSSDDGEEDDDQTHEEAEEEEEEEQKAKEGAGATRHKRGATAATDGNHVRYCALEKARVAFFGAASFTGSASPHRLLGSPHVPITPSRSTSTRASASGAKINAAVPPSTTARPRLEEDLDAHILARSTPLKATEEASGTVLDGTPVLQATAPEDASPSPQKLFAEPAADEAEARAALAEEAGEEETQDETSASSPAFDGERFGCEVCDALHQYFQSLLTRGVVLDRFNHKDLAFAWWVLGRNMDTAALDHVGPLRREPLLISLRNYYFNLLTKHEAKKRARQQRRAAAQAKSQGESPHQPQQEDGEAEAKQGPQPTTQAATDGMAPPPDPLPHAGAKRRRSDAGHPAKAPAKSTRRQASPASSASQPSSSASSRSSSRSPRVVPQDASSSGDGVERMLLDGVDLSQLPPASSRASSTTSNRRSAQERRQAVEDTWSSVRQGRHRPTSSTTSVAMADGEKEPVPIVSGAGVPSKKTTPVPGPTPRAPATTTKSAKKPAAATASKAAPPPPPSSPAPPATAKASGGSSTTATNSSGPKSPTPSSQANRKGTSSAVSASTTATATTAGATSNSKKKTGSHAKTSTAAETTQTALHAKATPAQTTHASRAVSESTTATTTDTTTAAVDTTTATATATATATTAPSRAKKGKTSTTATTNSSQATNKGPSETEASSSPTASTVAEAAVVAAEVPGAPTPSHAPAVAPADHAQCLMPLLQLSAFQTSVEDRIQGRLGTAEDSLYAFLMGSATHQRDAKGRPIVPKPTPALASGTEGRSTTQKEPHEETAAADKSDTMGTTSSASASAPQAKGRRGRHKLNNRGAVDPSLFLSTCRYDHGAFEAELARRASARAESHKRPRQEEEPDEERRIKEESETPRAAPQNSSRRENLADTLYPLPLSRRYDAAGHRLPHSFTPVTQAEVMAPPLHTAACVHPLPEPPHTHSLRSLPYAQQCLLVWEAASRIECFAEAQAERERQKAALLSTMRMTTRRMRATIEESEPSAVVAKMKKRARRTKALSERGAEPAEEEDEESTPWQAAPRLPAEHEEESEETSESEPDTAPPSATPSPLPHQPSASSDAPHTSVTVKVKRERDGAPDTDQRGRHTSVSSTASHEHASAAAALTGQPARCYIDYWAYYRPS